MRRPYAHAATLRLPPGDDAAPGAAVTVALCGHWEHDGPCPLAAHHTAAARDGDLLHLRILFAAEATDEPEVRRRIGAALAAWPVVRSGPTQITAAETAHANRLANA